MRTATQIYKSQLYKGLRPDTTAKNSGLLFRLLNARPTPLGLESIEPIVSPLSNAYAVDWPFPQLIKGRKLTFICQESSIATVDPSTWSVSPITLYQRGSNITTDSITGSGYWHLVDLYSNYLLTNGTSFIYKDKRSVFEELDSSERARVIDELTIGTGCYHRGRAILSGFDPANFWTYWESTYNPELQTIIDGLRNDLPQGMNFLPEVEESTVWWSSIGGGDVLFLILPSLMTGSSDSYFSQGYDSNFQFLHDLILKNQFGWMPMPWQGRVRCVRPLGKAVMVYGDEGVSALSLENGTYGLVEFDEAGEVGIHGRAAVAGMAEHVFVDRLGYLHHVDRSLKIDRLGYKEFFKNMENIVVTFDPGEGEYYIGDGIRSYILNRHGLCETNQRCSSISRFTGNLNGIVSESGSFHIEIGIEDTDIYMPGIKKVLTVVVSMTTSMPDIRPMVAVDYKLNINDEWRRSNWKLCSKEGAAFPMVSGVSLRTIVRIPANSNSKVDHIQVSYQGGDNRYTRGFYVNQANTESGS